MTFPFSIHIPRRSLWCLVCNKRFADEERIVSTLREEHETWVRLDGCVGCLLPPHNEAKMRGAETRWISCQPIKDKLEKKTHDEAESGWALLLEMMEGKISLEEEEELFILSLYLMRKKVLVERKGHLEKEGRLSILYEHLASGQMILIPKLDLGKLQLPLIQGRIKAKLEAFDALH